MWGRFIDVFRRRRLDADLDSQLAHHLDALEAEYRTHGLAPGDARAAARRDMGGLTQVRDAYRDQHGVPVFETIWRNGRFAVRALRRTPGLTATIVLTLALGIGANSAVFSTIDTVLLRPLSFPDADELVRVIQTQDGARNTWIAPLRLEDWNRLSSSFAAITGYAVEDSSDTTGDLPVRVRRARVSPRFVQVWGVAPAVGRGFTDGEHRLGAPSVAVISDRYWRDRFGADPSVMGKNVFLSGRPYAIVGVMPISFRFPERDVDIAHSPHARRTDGAAWRRGGGDIRVAAGRRPTESGGIRSRRRARRHRAGHGRRVAQRVSQLFRDHADSGPGGRTLSTEAGRRRSGGIHNRGDDQPQLR